MDYRRHHFVFFNPDFEAFLRDTKTALDAHQLPHRVFDEIFSDTNLTPHPSCNGSAFPSICMHRQLGHLHLLSSCEVGFHLHAFLGEGEPLGETSFLPTSVAQDVDGVRSAHRWHDNLDRQLAHEVLHSR